MSEDDNMITVKLKRGNTEIEITCPEEKVKQTVENVIRGLEPLNPTLFVAILYTHYGKRTGLELKKIYQMYLKNYLVTATIMIKQVFLIHWQI